MSASRGHGNCRGHGHGVPGPGVRSGTHTQKQAKEPDVKDEPLSSDPVTITEEEDEDETVIKIKVNQPCTLQKARRGKPFKPAGGGIHKIDKGKECSVELDRTPVKTPKKGKKMTKNQEVKVVE